MLAIIETISGGPVMVQKGHHAVGCAPVYPQPVRVPQGQRVAGIAGAVASQFRTARAGSWSSRIASSLPVVGGGGAQAPDALGRGARGAAVVTGWISSASPARRCERTRFLVPRFKPTPFNWHRQA